MMRIRVVALVFAFGLLLARPYADEEALSLEGQVSTMEHRPGFVPFYWDEALGKVWLEIENWGEEFLYVHSLTAGLGSNDVGLDRNQLGDTRVVRVELSWRCDYLAQWAAVYEGTRLRYGSRRLQWKISL